jgi:hypothetical protein
MKDFFTVRREMNELGTFKEDKTQRKIRNSKEAIRDLLYKSPKAGIKT